MEEEVMEEKLEDLKEEHEKKNKKLEKQEAETKKDLMIKELSQGIKELQDKYLYQQAEFQNYKRRRETVGQVM